MNLRDEGRGNPVARPPVGWKDSWLPGAVGAPAGKGRGMLLKVIGAVLAIWLAFVVLGFVIKAVAVMAVLGGLLFVGAAGYAAIKGRKQGQIGR